MSKILGGFVPLLVFLVHVAAAPDADPTVVSDCHLHETIQYCMAGTTEYRVMTTATATSALPARYTGCHSHGSDLYCMTPDGGEVEMESAMDHESPSHSDEEPEELNCHFHAGVEHCVGAEGEEESAVSCDRVDRAYNIPLRIGLLFVVLITSAIGVFGPILIMTIPSVDQSSLIFAFLTQFGTGVIFSTAFVHLYTHASLMFANECLGELSYEGTTSAIVMAGLFLSFAIDYLGMRWLQWRTMKVEASTESLDHRGYDSSEFLRVVVLESGIIFHSLLIGLTLVVAGDSFFIILFIVIVFHQFFEGIALGSRIAALSSVKSTVNGPPLSTWAKLVMAAPFAIVTPIGMAIGIGVLDQFNGNDPSTIVALGTLDALSAGILIWVGVVEMWSHDWMHGALAQASPMTVAVGMLGLITGALLMSVLGKWA